MLNSLPETVHPFMIWAWKQIAPYFDELHRPITAETAADWLADWSRLNALIDERYSRLYVATTQDTTDDDAEQRYHAFLEDILPKTESADQQLKQILLDSDLEPDGFETPLRNMRADADLFREENLPLLTDERKIISEFNRILGAQTVEWDGEERTLLQMATLQTEPDRDLRKRAWRAVSNKQLADRDAINAIWVRFMNLRREIAQNAGHNNYRDYRWLQKHRFDYTPDDCKTFMDAIEEVAVPATQRIYERRRANLGVETLRPWDLGVDPTGQSPLRPYETVDELEQKGSSIFHRVDPQLGEYYDTMRDEGLLDLANRKGKGPGAYSTGFKVTQRPFIFMNAVGHYAEVRTLIHEAGHAFHAFERFKLPYYHQQQSPMEFNEVASMAMELLAAPYWRASEGGFYSDEDYVRARVQHLEKIVLFWPYMAVVDGFQHWVYENHDAATDPENCDAVWAELWDRFRPGVDYSELEADKRNGWHRKRHIHRTPFYYVEYGLAQLGAVLVWRNALSDQAGAVADYRRALALGGTVSLPDLYTAAGVKFAFDADTLCEAVELIEQTIEELA